MSPKIKMVAIDLDGTLLTTDKRITPYNLASLNKMMLSGVILVIATGRPLVGLDIATKSIPDVRYVLTANGARVVDLKIGKTIIEDLLDYEKTIKVLELLYKFDCLKEIFYDGQGYINKEDMDKVHLYHKKQEICDYVRQSRMAVPDIMEVVKANGGGADKGHAIFADMNVRQQVYNELEIIGGLNLKDSLSYNIEINKCGVNKGSSLIRLGEMLSIDRQEIMAIGDGDNDIEMLEMVGFGVAMKNARDGVKRVADYVTLSNDEDGVAKAIEKFVFQQEKQ